jgi:hypothetical protein
MTAPRLGHFSQPKTRLDLLDYLMGSLGTLLMLPGVMLFLRLEAPLIEHILLGVLPLPGLWGIWRLLHRFAGVAERSVAICCLVLWWYILGYVLLAFVWLGHLLLFFDAL